jgi:hypothetical protein
MGKLMVVGYSPFEPVASAAKAVGVRMLRHRRVVGRPVTNVFMV